MSFWQFWREDGPMGPRAVRGDTVEEAAELVAKYMAGPGEASPGERFLIGYAMVESRVIIWAPHTFVLDQDLNPVQVWPKRRLARA